jgi:hypothetical protein
MIKNQQKFIIAMILLATASTNTATSSAASSTPKSPPKPPCRVNISNPHESTKYGRKYFVLAVKANATVICDKPITNLIVYIDLYKRAFLTSQRLAQFKSKEYPAVLGGKEIKVSGPIVLCKNWKKTKFFSMVYSTATVGGQAMQAPWRKSFSQELECGT